MALRCGVIGLGRGNQFVKAFAANRDCEVVAVCDPSPKALEPFSGLRAHRELGPFFDEGLDVVAVISPGPVHAEQSLAALERGAHVLCETPSVYSLGEARRVLEAVRRTGLKYMLAENYIWQGWCGTLKRMADEGRFGEIVYAEGDYTHDCRDLMLADEQGFVPYADRASRPGARKTWRATHLPPIQYCSHTLGPLLHLIRDRVVSAYGLGVRGRAAPDLVETDLEAALFETENGAIIRLTNGFSVAHPMALYYSIVGTRGSAKLLRAGETVAKWWTDAAAAQPLQAAAAQAGEPVPHPKGWQDMPPACDRRNDGRTDLQAMVDAFIESIVRGTPPPLDVYQSLDMTLPGILAHQSALRGGVKLPVPDLRCGHAP